MTTKSKRKQKGRRLSSRGTIRVRVNKKTQKGGTLDNSRWYTIPSKEETGREPKWDFVLVESVHTNRKAWVDLSHSIGEGRGSTHHRTLPVGYAPGRKDKYKVNTAQEAEAKYLEGYEKTKKILEEERLALKKEKQNWIRKLEINSKKMKEKAKEMKERKASAETVEEALARYRIEKKVHNFPLRANSGVFVPKGRSK